MDVYVKTGNTLIEAQGITLPHCTDAQIDSVTALTVQQNNALKCERNRLLFRLQRHQDSHSHPQGKDKSLKTNTELNQREEITLVIPEEKKLVIHDNFYGSL